MPPSPTRPSFNGSIVPLLRRNALRAGTRAVGSGRMRAVADRPGACPGKVGPILAQDARPVREARLRLPTFSGSRWARDRGGPHLLVGTVRRQRLRAGRAFARMAGLPR